MRVELPILQGSLGGGRSQTINAEQLINLFVELDPESARGLYLAPTFGLVEWGTSAAGEGRGIIKFGSKLYAVVGNTLYEWSTSGGVGTNRGTLDTSTGRVQMAHNGAANGYQLLIVTGGTGYTFNQNTTTFAAIADADFTALTPSTCCFMDGYFLVEKTGTAQVWQSASYDGRTWSSTAFATAERVPDDIMGVFADRRELYVLGTDSTEWWYNDGSTSGLSFVPHQHGIQHIGCAAKHSVCKFGETVVMLADDERGRPYVAILEQGYQWIHLSTPALEYIIDAYATVNDAFCWVMRRDGNELLVITFPTAGASFLFNATSKRWAQIASDLGGTYPERHRINGCTYFNNKNLGIDYTNGKIYRLDMTVYTEDGTAIQRRRRTAHINKTRDRVTFDSLELLVEPAVGADALVGWTLKTSKNGGKTFQSTGRTLPVGASTEYAKRLVYRNLGVARDWVFEFSTSANFKPIIYGAVGEVEASE